MPFIPHARRKRHKSCVKKTVEGLCENGVNRPMTFYDSVFMLALAIIFIIIIMKGNH